MDHILCKESASAKRTQLYGQHTVYVVQIMARTCSGVSNEKCFGLQLMRVIM
jgi:hypothetical protein